MTTLTAKQIRESKASGSMGMSYNGFDSAPNKINFENGVSFEFESSSDRQKTWNKLIRMGFLLTENDNNTFERLMNT